MSSLENTKCETAPGPRVRKRWLIAAAAYYGLLTFLSHLPGTAIRALPFSFWDKAVHFGAYAVLGFCIGLAFSRRPGSAKYAVFVAMLLTGTMGVLDEIHQMFTPGRFASVGDAVADFLGGTAGALFGVILLRRK